MKSREVLSDEVAGFLTHLLIEYKGTWKYRDKLYREIKHARDYYDRTK